VGSSWDGDNGDGGDDNVNDDADEEEASSTGAVAKMRIAGLTQLAMLGSSI